MPRSLAFVVVLASLTACAYDAGPIRPGVTAATGASAPAPSTSQTGPTSATPTFTAEGCPVNEPAFCEQATFLANALVVGDSDAVLRLFRSERYDCRDLDPEVFPQCAEDDLLKGYVLGTYQDEFFVQPPARLERTLGFLVEAVDPEYEDELGDSRMQILGVSSCGKGADTSHHVVYLVGLNDPESTLPGDRFLGTYGFTERDDGWAIDVTLVSLFTDWQLALDDPLSEIACGGIQPWG